MAVDGRTPRVLLVEDDLEIAQAVQRSLRLEGYEVRIAPDGERALADHRSYVPDLVLLDLGLPGVDGIEVARQIRSDGDVPILMLTARDAVESRVEGLDSGADDYLVKPFERQELLARLRALLRRRPPRGTASLVSGDLELNPDTHEVRRGERDIELTQREFELLEYLMRNERIVISRQRLLHEVWGAGQFSPPHPPGPAAARRGLRLRPVLADEHHRGLRPHPAAQARGRRRAATAAHDPRRGVRPACLTASPSAGAWRSPRPG